MPKRRLHTISHVILGAVAALTALWITPPVSSETAIGRIEVAFRPGPGRTHLELPPVGTITADTHAVPLGLHIQVQRLELEELGELGDDSDRDQAIAAARTKLIQALVLQGGLTILIAATLAGLAATALHPTRRRDAWKRPVGIGVGVLLILGGGAATFYQQTAFARPVFHGPVQAAPDVLRKLDNALDGAGQISNRIDTITSHLATLSTPLAPDAVEDTTNVLHVSDIHSNPVAILWVNELHERFDIDIVVDTGDITSFGYSPEAATIESPLTIERNAYWVVYGNHDADSVRARLNQRLTPLHLTTRTIGELRIGGIDDPTFTPQEGVTDAQARQQYARSAQELAELCRKERPDVIAVHNPEQAEAVDGCANIVLSGHLHESSQQRLPGGTLLLVAGTTGAGGVEGLSPDGQYTAQILRFRGSTLVNVDIVSINPETGGFTTERINPTNLAES